MALFRNTRDTLKANGLMSHLEYAVHHFRPRDMWALAGPKSFRG